MNQEQFNKLCKDLLKLKEKLKCPICLDIIEEIAELECGHKFCVKCYSTHKTNSNNQQHHCPMCKIVIKRRSPIYKDDFGNKLASFLTTVCKEIEGKVNVSIEEIAQQKPKSVVKKDKHASERSKSTKSSNFNPLALKEIDENNGTQSKTNKDNSKTKKLINKPKKNQNTQSTSKEAQYKKLVKTPRKGNRDNLQPEISKRTTRFKPASIVSGASTSKENAFDRLMQKSQDLVVNKRGTQRKYTRKKKDKEELKYTILNFNESSNKKAVLTWLNDTRNVFDRLTQTQYIVDDQKSENIPMLDLASVSQVYKNKLNNAHSTLKRKTRARSLDLEIKPRRAKSCRSQGSILDGENYTIEEINTEEVLKKAEQNFIMQLIGDECLDKMENELKNKPNNIQKDHQTTQHSVSDWQRMEKITKTIRKKERVPNKLKIVLQSSQSTKEKKLIEKTLKINLKNENIKELTDIKKADDVSIEELKENVNSNINKVDVIQQKSEDVKIDKHLKPTNTNMYDLNDFEQYVKENIEEISKDHEQINISQNSTSSNKENNENLTNVNKPKKIIILENVIIKKTFEIDPYLLPTQKINTSDRSFEKNNLQDSSLVDESFHEFKNFGEVMATLQKNLKKYSDDLDDNKQLTKRHIESIQNYLNKLNDFHMILYNNVPKVTESLNKQDQTETIVKSCQVQTDSILYCDSEVQTVQDSVCDSCRNITKISPQSPLKLKTQYNTRSRRNSAKSNTSKVMQQDDLAATLDLINFETQEVEKQYLQDKTKDELNHSNEEKNCTTNITTNTTLSKQQKSSETIKKNTQKSTTDQNPPENEDFLCTLGSDIIAHKTSSSRKRILSDSDSSDVVVVPKRKCNRFIKDDLSIEFGSTEKFKSQKKSSLINGCSPETSMQDDEEYLNNILKKYGVGQESSPESNKDTANRELDDDFENIVANVNDNIEKLSKIKGDGKHSKTSSQNYKTSLDDDNIFLNDQNLSKFDNDVKNYKNLNGQTENSDIIAETEAMEPLSKRTKLQNLNDPFFEELSAIVPCDNDDKKYSSPVKGGRETFCEELEDSMDDDFVNMDIQENKNAKDIKSNEDDLFSDEDIVESTPQKEKRSQSNVCMNLTNKFPELDNVDKDIIDNFDINFAPLSPPPGFEDEKDPTDQDITVINIEEHNLKEPIEDVTEKYENIDILSQEKMNTATSKPNSNRPITPENFLEGYNRNGVLATPRGLSSLNIITKKMNHSTPLTQSSILRETIGLSPIVQEKSLFEKAYASNTISNKSVDETPRKHNILTSLPKQKSILNYVKSSQETTASGSIQKPCIACTRLNKDQIQSISLLTNKKLVTYSAKFNDTVTHMIVTVDETKRIRDYTMKFVSAVASGIWVVGFEWIQECLKANSIIPEGPYEALDDSGNSGPKTSRLTRAAKPLFKDYKFFCVNPLYSTSVDEVEDVITKLGGIIVKNLENLKEKDGKIGLIITEGRSTQDFEIYERWLEKYRVVTVDIEWLSRSVGRYKILSVRPYIWCSDDLVDELDYPAYLTENISSSSEQF